DDREGAACSAGDGDLLSEREAVRDPRAGATGDRRRRQSRGAGEGRACERDGATISEAGGKRQRRVDPVAAPQRDPGGEGPGRGEGATPDEEHAAVVRGPVVVPDDRPDALTRDEDLLADGKAEAEPALAVREQHAAGTRESVVVVVEREVRRDREVVGHD